MSTGKKKSLNVDAAVFPEGSWAARTQAGYSSVVTARWLLAASRLRGQL